MSLEENIEGMLHKVAKETEEKIRQKAFTRRKFFILAGTALGIAASGYALVPRLIPLRSEPLYSAPERCVACEGWEPDDPSLAAATICHNIRMEGIAFTAEPDAFSSFYQLKEGGVRGRPADVFLSIFPFENSDLKYLKINRYDAFKPFFFSAAGQSPDLTSLLFRSDQYDLIKTGLKKLAFNNRTTSGDHQANIYQDDQGMSYLFYAFRGKIEGKDVLRLCEDGTYRKAEWPEGVLIERGGR